MSLRVAGEGKKLLGVGSDGAVLLFLNERAEEKTERVGRLIRFVDALVFGDRIGALGPGDFGAEARDPFLAEKFAIGFEQKLGRCHVIGHRESLYLDRDDSDLGKTLVKLRAMLRNKLQRWRPDRRHADVKREPRATRRY